MTAADLSAVPTEVREDLERWRALLAPLLTMERGVTAAIRELAAATGIPHKTIERKYCQAKKGGILAILDRRACGPAMWRRSDDVDLSLADREALKKFCEDFQRSSMAAVRAFRQDWSAGKIFTTTRLNPQTGFPRGWSERNLMRHLPTRFELVTARIGRSAAAEERRLVYTTRRDLWVGSHFLFDDIWHDHEVNVLSSRLRGRPLEFHALDLYSANKFAWGMRVRLENPDGTMVGLKGADMRFLVAQIFATTGYSPRGTVCVVEHGTAAIGENLERILHDESGGAITVAKSGMEGASAAAHQYAGRSKGNFRFKAALESLGNLIHNEMAYLPGQVGKDRNHFPEQMHGLRKHNDALLAAIAYLPPEQVEMLKWDLMTIQQFQSIAGNIYQRINARTDHDLEGWDMHYVPDTRTGRMRRLSPAEVWRPGARQLVRLRPEAIALILLDDNAVERTTRRGLIELNDHEISGDVLRYDAHQLADREKYLTVLNPYHPEALFVFDARGRYVAACPRVHSVSRADVEAVQRECGAAAKVEADRLAPFRARHLGDAREKAAMHRHNAEILGGRSAGASRLPSAADLDALTTPDEPATRTLPADDAGDLADELRSAL